MKTLSCVEGERGSLVLSVWRSSRLKLRRRVLSISLCVVFASPQRGRRFPFFCNRVTPTSKATVAAEAGGERAGELAVSLFRAPEDFLDGYSSDSCSPSCLRGPRLKSAVDGAADPQCSAAFAKRRTLNAPRRTASPAMRVLALVRWVDSDLTLNHEAPIHNSRLLRAYTRAGHPNVLALLKLIKHWTKQRDIWWVASSSQLRGCLRSLSKRRGGIFELRTGKGHPVMSCLCSDGGEGFANSYTWQLLVIYFFQRCLVVPADTASGELRTGVRDWLSEQGRLRSLRELHEALRRPDVLPLLPQLQLRLRGKDLVSGGGDQDGRDAASSASVSSRREGAPGTGVASCTECGKALPYPLRICEGGDEEDAFFFDPDVGCNSPLSQKAVRAPSLRPQDREGREDREGLQRETVGRCSCGAWSFCGRDSWPEERTDLTFESYARLLLEDSLVRSGSSFCDAAPSTDAKQPRPAATQGLDRRRRLAALLALSKKASFEAPAAKALSAVRRPPCSAQPLRCGAALTTEGEIEEMLQQTRVLSNVVLLSQDLCQSPAALLAAFFK